VKLLPNGDSVELTKGVATRFGPVFTPDGTRIAYTEVDASASGFPGTRGRFPHLEDSLPACFQMRRVCHGWMINTCSSLRS